MMTREHVSLSPENQVLVDEFCDTVWLEDGLSRNTLDAYRRDMHLFASGWKRNGPVPGCWMSLTIT